MEGKVYWITGLSGAGKTTIGKALYARMKEDYPAVVLLDGDAMREAVGDVFGYTPNDRFKCAMYYSRLCKMIAEQTITVICCTVSMFDDVREWNRKNISDYFEVYIKVNQDTLYKRDQKGLYSGLMNGTSSKVTGMDIPFEEPKNPDMVLENNGDLSVGDCVNIILKQSAIRGG